MVRDTASICRAGVAGGKDARAQLDVEWCRRMACGGARRGIAELSWDGIGIRARELHGVRLGKWASLAFAGRLCVVERRIRLSAQVVDGGAVRRSADVSDADADPHGSTGVQRIWQIGYAMEELFGEALRFRPSHAERYNHELVAAQTRDHVGFSNAGSQTVGNGDQNRVARVMPEAVVDWFEAIEIKVEQDKLPVRLRSAR